jgi:hypothetical protein
MFILPHRYLIHSQWPMGYHREHYCHHLYRWSPPNTPSIQFRIIRGRFQIIHVVCN